MTPWKDISARKWKPWAVAVLVIFALTALVLGWYVVLFAAFVVFAALVLPPFPTRHPLYRTEPILTNRPEITEDEFFERYYRDSGIPKQTVVECIREVANGAQIPVGKVRPSDVFEVDYKPIPGEGWQELTWFLADERKEAGVREIEQLDSADDLIRCVHRLRTGKAANGANREKIGRK